ncbi:MAG: hypothetical protein ACRBN8_33650 [Nannocystales bacterium]
MNQHPLAERTEQVRDDLQKAIGDEDFATLVRLADEHGVGIFAEPFDDGTVPVVDLCEIWPDDINPAELWAFIERVVGQPFEREVLDEVVRSVLINSGFEIEWQRDSLRGFVERGFDPSEPIGEDDPCLFAFLAAFPIVELVGAAEELGVTEEARTDAAVAAVAQARLRAGRVDSEKVAFALRLVASCASMHAEPRSFGMPLLHTAAAYGCFEVFEAVVSRAEDLDAPIPKSRPWAAPYLGTDDDFDVKKGLTVATLLNNWERALAKAEKKAKKNDDSRADERAFFSNFIERAKALLAERGVAPRTNRASADTCSSGRPT